jgi:hypothetical protein
MISQLPIQFLCNDLGRGTFRAPYDRYNPYAHLVAMSGSRMP